MRRIKDQKQQLFDPRGYLSPKRRRMLEEGWPGLFRQHLLGAMPVEAFNRFFAEAFGRLTKELHVLNIVHFDACMKRSP